MLPRAEARAAWEVLAAWWVVLAVRAAAVAVKVTTAVAKVALAAVVTADLVAADKAQAVVEMVALVAAATKVVVDVEAAEAAKGPAAVVRVAKVVHAVEVAAAEEARAAALAVVASVEWVAAVRVVVDLAAWEAGEEEVVAANLNTRKALFAKSRTARQAKVRRGMLLVIVLIVVMFLALGAYSFTDLMLTHQESAQLTGRQIQTRQLVDSGIEYTRFFLSKPPATRLESGGVFNNPTIFKGITMVADPDPRERTSFCILSPNLNDDGNLAGLRYGLEDESTRLNLNTLLVLEKQQEGSAVQLLMSLPGMTEEIADAILDWIDPDDEPRPLGAEIDHYSGLSPAYRPKNGPLDSVEELLLVRGITPEMLLGADVNRNGMLDPQEGGASGTASSASDRGWSAYFTLHSMETNLQENGQPRVYLNGNDMQMLADNLSAAGFPEDWTNFIIAYRQNGPNAAAGQASVAASALPAPDLTKPARIPLVQLLDLCDARLRITTNGQSQVIASPFTSGLGGGMPVWLPKLMDTCTINPAITIPGRININQAPAHILRGIPGMNEDIITEILSRRAYEPGADDANKRHETWIMAEGIVTLQEMRALMPFVCAGGDVYRAQVVGYYQSGEASSRVEAIFDASAAPARVLFWRDLSHYGRGYAVETLGVDFTESSGTATPTTPGGF